MSESKDFKVMGRCINQEDDRKIKDDSVEVDRTKRTGRRPGRRPIKVDQKLKLEKSRQSARECRARKKLRYQYLEDLVKNREQAIFALKDELELYKRLCKEVDFGKVTDELKQVLEDSKHKYGQSKLVGDTDSSSSPAISSSSASQSFGSSDQMNIDDSNSTTVTDRTDREHSTSLPNSLQGSMNELNEIGNEQVSRHNKVAGLLSMPKKVFRIHQDLSASNVKILENDDILKDIKLRSGEEIQSSNTTRQENCTYSAQESSTFRGKLSPEKRLPNLRELLTSSSEPMEVKIPMQHMFSNGANKDNSLVGTHSSYSSISNNQNSSQERTIDLTSRLYNPSAQIRVARPNFGTKPQVSSFRNIVVGQPGINNLNVTPRIHTTTQQQQQQQQQSSNVHNFNQALRLPNRIDFSKNSNINILPLRRGISSSSTITTSRTPAPELASNFFKPNEGHVLEKDNRVNSPFSIDFMDMDIEQLKSVYIDSCDDVKNDPMDFDIGVSSSNNSAIDPRLNRTRYQFGKRRSQSDPVTAISEGQFDSSSQNWDFLDDMVLKK